MTEEIRTERRGDALWIIVDRPVARNAMTFAMYEHIAAICKDANADASVKALVLTGAGEAFVAGTDISQFADFREASQALDYEKRMDAWLGAIEDVRVPTIAALRGPVVGGGLAIASACDLRVAAPSARFGVPVARTLGNCFSAANLVRIAALVGLGRVKELILTARLIDAQEARAIGLVTDVVAGEDALEPHVARLVEQLTSFAPLTLRATKEMVRRIRQRMLPDEASDLVALCYTSADFREGVAAFIERRKPVWKGQ
ncbi:MAG TPA: enoyl-CoA hydratase/isomerase family protein [Candidatus Limnocylindria bacterium]|jgi:enoyl-CoA hydratase/carnithine racemase|nr:enoyl-CoA hydratase/isomerase family protein [Candidatus Limnocylindria bacterium]